MKKWKRYCLILFPLSLSVYCQPIYYNALEKVGIEKPDILGNPIDPVLKPLEDYVLFLKHNLNARAITSLEGDLTTIESGVSSLVTQMEEAITEAESFLRSMENRE